MIRNIRITVRDRGEFFAIKAALDDPAIRAFLIIDGTLKRLDDDNQRRRVLTYVADVMEERKARKSK